MVPSVPGTNFIVIHSDPPLCSFETVLDPEPRVGHMNQLFNGDVFSGIAEVVTILRDLRLGSSHHKPLLRRTESAVDLCPHSHTSRPDHQRAFGSFSD